MVSPKKLTVGSRWGGDTGVNRCIYAKKYRRQEDRGQGQTQSPMSTTLPDPPSLAHLPSSTHPTLSHPQGQREKCAEHMSGVPVSEGTGGLCKGELNPVALTTQSSPGILWQKGYYQFSAE